MTKSDTDSQIIASVFQAGLWGMFEAGTLSIHYLCGYLSPDKISSGGPVLRQVERERERTTYSILTHTFCGGVLLKDEWN